MHPLKLLFQTTIIPALTYKKGTLIILSIPFSVIVDWFYTGSFLGISITFLCLFFFLTIVDFAFGIYAAWYSGLKIESSKIAFTIYKVTISMVFFWMIYETNKLIIHQNEWAYDQVRHFLTFIRTFVFVLLVLREYISIGENIEKRFKRKPYIFILADKIANTIENKLIKKIEDTDLCDPKDKKNETN